MSPSFAAMRAPMACVSLRRLRSALLLGVLCALLMAEAAIAATPTTNVIYTFTGADDGANPLVGLVQGPNGTFYGATSESGTEGNAGSGTLFSITSGGTLTVIEQLSQGTADNITGLLQGTGGTVYAVANGGGPDCNVSAPVTVCGSILQIAPDGTVSTLYAFTAEKTPLISGPTSLVLGSDDNFYGTSRSGGSGTCGTDPPGCGTVFKLAPAGVLTILYSFSGGADGGEPLGLIQGSDGNLYGLTPAYSGLTGENSGTIFRVDVAGTFTTLYTFPYPQTASSPFDPQAALVEAPDGNFYGSTLGGGINGAGTLFRMTPPGELTVLYAFGGTDADPGAPQAPLIVGSDGNLYGTAPGQLDGGSQGSVFSLSTAGSYQVLTAFAAPSATGPAGGVIEGADGSLYGTLDEGGPADAGGVFQLTGAIAANVPPMPPTVMISATPDSVTLGQSATLSWSSTNAGTCTASGAWSGGEPTSGTQSLTPSAAGTDLYTLTCTGVGGSSNASADLTVSAPPSNVVLTGKAGGAGAIGAPTLLGLALLALARVVRPRRSRPPMITGSWVTLPVLMLLALTLSGPPVSAQELGFNVAQSYVGLRAGESSYAIDVDDLDTSLAAAGDSASVISLQRHEAAGVLYGGIPFFHNLSLEAGVAYLGVYHLQLATTAMQAAKVSADAAHLLGPAGRGFTLGLGGPIDLSRWFAIEPHLGLLLYQSRQEISDPPTTYRSGDYGAGLDAGAMLLIHPAPALYVGAGWECFERCDVRVVSAQIEYHFGR